MFFRTCRWLPPPPGFVFSAYLRVAASARLGRERPPTIPHTCHASAPPLAGHLPTPAPPLTLKERGQFPRNPPAATPEVADSILPAASYRSTLTGAVKRGLRAFFSRRRMPMRVYPRLSSVSRGGGFLLFLFGFGFGILVANSFGFVRGGFCGGFRGLGDRFSYGNINEFQDCQLGGVALTLV